MPDFSHQVCLVLLVLARFTSGLLTNRTIDDTNGDSVTGALPTYSPFSGVWNVGQTCGGCSAQPNKTDAFDQSWHDATCEGPSPLGPPSVSVSFNGTAVYVFCIVANTNAIPVNLTFTLDGEAVGSYIHEPIPDTPFQYNVSVYTNNSIPNGDHSLVVTAQCQSQPTLLLFDYIEYTFDSDLSVTSSSATPIPTNSAAAIIGHSKPSLLGPIIGGVLGGLALIAIAIFVFLFYCRSRRRQSRTDVVPSLDSVSEKGYTDKTSQLPALLGSRNLSQAGIDPFILPARTHPSTSALRQRLESTDDVMPAAPSSHRGETPFSADFAQSQPYGATSSAAPSTILIRAPSVVDASDSVAAVQAETVFDHTYFAPYSSEEEKSSQSSPRQLGSSSLRTPSPPSVSGQVTSSPPLAMPNLPSTATDPETRAQIESLWQEVRMLRMQQESQQLAPHGTETLPAYSGRSESDAS